MSMKSGPLASRFGLCLVPAILCAFAVSGNAQGAVQKDSQSGGKTRQGFGSGSDDDGSGGGKNDTPTVSWVSDSSDGGSGGPGTVLSHQKISATEGGFGSGLDERDLFGFSIGSLGDLDGDGVGDLAVGAPNDDDGGTTQFDGGGAVWVLFLNEDGTVKSHQKISATQGGFNGTLDAGDFFGSSVASLDDLDRDGVTDLAVGAYFDDDGGPTGTVDERGAVWVLFLNADGTVKSQQKISDTEGGFTGTLDDSDAFGFSVASLGDLDGDGVGDLAVGAPRDDDGFAHDRGAVWILFLTADGTVKAEQKISDTEGGGRFVRRTGAEKMEMIRLVEQSDLPVRQTLRQLGIASSTFYGWYQRYLDGGPEALEDRRPFDIIVRQDELERRGDALLGGAAADVKKVRRR